MKIIFTIFSVVFLIYLLLPGPTSINDFPALPNSIKSDLEGDTIQVSNVAAYFSNNYRDFVAPFYKGIYKNLNWLPFPPITLNHPPEYAFNAIKDQTQSTYLEEYVYPLRDSLYVNGLEPYTKDGERRFAAASYFEIKDVRYQTKVTLRYYPSPIWARIIVWVGINLAIIFFWHYLNKVFTKERN